MLIDTHCHIFTGLDDGTITALVPELNERFAFIQDIGTKPDDFAERYRRAKSFFPVLPPSLRFSLGIWPHACYISRREEALDRLEKNILAAKKRGLSIALGECGLDRFWNGTNAQKHGDGTEDTAAEEALFEGQLRLAERYRLPVIVHSRDAYTDTLKVIDRVGYHNGVIHCYSYGAEEAVAFLERGWYISFSGNCTYPTTHVKKERMAELVKSVPPEKILLETDAPFLAPAPHRGEPNNPLWVSFVYEQVAAICGMDIEVLSAEVFKNAVTLFG